MSFSETEFQMMQQRVLVSARQSKAGALAVREIEKASGKNTGQKGAVPPLSSRKTAAQLAGLSPDQAKDAIRVANVGQDSFESQVESDKPPGITALAEQRRRPRWYPLTARERLELEYTPGD